MCLDALASIADSESVPQSIKHLAYHWCRSFASGFTTFTRVGASPATNTKLSADDRLMIVTATRLQSLIDAEQTRKDLFYELTENPLRTDYDQRRQKVYSHNSYNRRVGAAASLAELSSQYKIARQRRVDLHNNEWGRDLMQQIAASPEFRADIFSPQTETKLLKSYDPTGIMQRNLAFINAAQETNNVSITARM
jgi:hypothetical protein